MKKPPGTEKATSTVRVLSISPIQADHTSLKQVFDDHADWPLCSDSKWALHPTFTLESAMPLLKQNRIPIILSERDLLPGTWKEVLAETLALPDPPLLIVSARLADDHLWAEALNLGAYDVLAKPFDPQEVV